MTVEEAKKIKNDFLANLDISENKDLQEIIAEIKDTAKKGTDYIHIELTKDMDKGIIENVLKHLGYHVEYKGTCNGTDYYIITGW
jgi:transcriptional regulator of NAD metabolism